MAGMTLDAALSASASFWTEERYQILRRGFRQLCDSFNWSAQFLHSEMKRIMPARAVPADNMTLRRFRGTKYQRTLFDNKQWMSALLLTCEAAVARAGRRSSDTPEQVRHLVELAREFRSQFGLAELERAAAQPEDDPNFAWYDRDTLANIADHIFVPTHDEPDNPEFPPNCPRFPASEPVTVSFEGRTVMVKDESRNPTASHKDRWAWEMIVRYKKMIGEALLNYSDPVPIKRYSMISTGSAAIALQSMLRVRQLPDLHVLMNEARRQPLIEKRLESIGARVFRANLEKEFFTDEMVKERTNNPKGVDVTPRDAEAPSKYSYYDWLAYEILNEDPRHIFVPFGSGGLFANLISVIHAEVNGKRDPRLLTKKELAGITVYGATTDDAKTRLDMLYAKYRPTLAGIEGLTEEYIAAGTIGPGSKVYKDLSDEEADGAVAEARAKKIRTGASGAAGLALFLRLAPQIPKNEPVLIVNTGCIFSPSA